MPERIQLRRTAGWRKPEGAVVVSRPSRWGNPVSLADIAGAYPSLDDLQVSVMAVRTFEPLAEHGRLTLPNWRFANGRRGPVAWTYPSRPEIRAGLRGRDLACWCPLDHWCHADVLLRIANTDEEPA